MCMIPANEPGSFYLPRQSLTRHDFPQPFPDQQRTDQRTEFLTGLVGQASVWFSISRVNGICGVFGFVVITKQSFITRTSTGISVSNPASCSQLPLRLMLGQRL